MLLTGHSSTLRVPGSSADFKIAPLPFDEEYNHQVLGTKGFEWVEAN